MEGEQKKEQNELRTDPERAMTADSDISETPANGHEGITAEAVASDYDEEKPKTIKDTVDYYTEEKNICEPGQVSEKEFSPTDNITTSEDFSVGINEVKSLPMAHEESVVFEINNTDDNGSPRLNLETPERDNSSPTRDEKLETEEEEPTADHLDKQDMSYEEYVRLVQELREERDKARQHNGQLQMELEEYFYNRAKDDTEMEKKLPVSEQLQEYEKHKNILTELKQQLNAESENVQQQAEQLDLQTKEMLDEVKNQWQAFLALKKNFAVRELRRHLGRKAAQAKVESVLAAEQLHQDELTKLRLENIKLSVKIHSLEAKFCRGQEQNKDPLQLQFEQLQAQRLELKKNAEKQNEELLKMEKKISSRLELLSNIKEKLFWTQMEVRAKQNQLAEVEAMVARKRDLLTRTKQVCSSIQRDNLRLKEQHGLLGNRVLLMDFDDTVDASKHLEEQLGNLKDQQAEIIFTCGR
ncbi:cilia- and flagella-associated protein 184 [Antennarius striatus]|uniref:cilia- and flagella-associated protein 184 n=1 Tax=Antennarius striatus TaxID=241820 RepID=UPI0035B3AAF3